MTPSPPLATHLTVHASKSTSGLSHPASLALRMHMVISNARPLGLDHQNRGQTHLARGEGPEVRQVFIRTLTPSDIRGMKRSEARPRFGRLAFS